MNYFSIIILLYYCKNIETGIFTNFEETVQSLFENSNPKYYQRVRDDKKDAAAARNKIKILNRAKTIEHRLNHGQDLPSYKLANDPHEDKQYYHMDAVLNQIRRQDPQGGRRWNTDNSSSSSSLELPGWREEFNEYWTQKKFEAINGTHLHGDQVNMIAARPWGTPCGDPNQHDMPWGTCMMSMECDGEYRIYRGDFLCGASQFVCCALQITNYDMNQGFDVSFADDSFATGSDEKKAKDEGSKKQKKKKKERERKKRRKERQKRKRLMKKKIKRIVAEIRKLLNRNFRNVSVIRKKKTTILKKYIKRLKKQFAEDRKNVREYHIIDTERIDKELENKLEEVRKVNINFLMNSTFRDIIVNGTINAKGARMLAEAYPELTPYLKGRLRRGGGGEASDGNDDDYLDYDIEYGAFYY